MIRLKLMKYRSVLLVFVVVFMIGCGNVVKVDTDVAPYDERVILTKAELVDTARFYGVDSLNVLISDSMLTIKLRKSPTIFILDENLNVYDLDICNAHFPDFNSMVLEDIEDESISEEQTIELHEMFSHLQYENGNRFEMRKNGKKSIFLSFGGYTPIYSKGIGYHINGLGEYNKNEFNLFLMTNCNYVELGLSGDEFLELCNNELKRMGLL